MNGKTLIIIATRGRPRQLKDMLEKSFATREGDTSFAVATDADDPSAGAYQDLLLPLARTGRVMWFQGERRSVGGWTNHIAMQPGLLSLFSAMGSFGDDHFPRTQGWDVKLSDVLAAAGGSGIACGNDLYQTPRLPTAPVITTDIIRALGWFCQPSMEHYFIDNVWFDLVEGRLAYREDVVVEHMHWGPGKAAVDQTYGEAQQMHWNADWAAYDRWCLNQRATDIETVRRVVSRAAV